MENFTSALRYWANRILSGIEWGFIFIGLVIYAIILIGLIALDWFSGYGKKS